MAIDTPEKRRRALNAVLRPVNVPLSSYQNNGERTADRANAAGFYYPDREPPREYAIFYAIELIPAQYVDVTSSLPTIEGFGLKDGIFRWITGTPGFNEYNVSIRMAA